MKIGPQESRRFMYAALIVLATVAALMPWWKNHHYLRDMYDYGLVLVANGRMELGERPYVDFTTPIQAGFLGLNWRIERLGGGTYGGLTLGGAGLIVLSVVGLALMLARRWSWWAAVVIGTVVTVSAASQHTILWHNSLGVFCLALVAWAAACAPVWRRETWGWHAVLVAGLFLGGINKLNFHLIGVAVALAWTVRAGLLRQGSWGRVAFSIGGIVLAGGVIPLGAELAWTGASPQLWWHNVVGLAGSSRLEILREMWAQGFLLRQFHNYYGPLLVPQVGLIGVIMLLAAGIGCWPMMKREGARWDWGLLPLAVILAGVAAVLLMATNFEILCLAGGAWLVLVVSLWLGFAPVGRRTLFVGGLIVPALALGVSAWWSAWQGQRSQFGYSLEPHKNYLPAEGFGPEFAGLAGLRVPPDIWHSMVGFSRFLPAPDATGHRPVFYGLGMEWAERYVPGLSRPGKPLWVHWGTSYSAEAIAALKEDLIEEDGYEVVLNTVARTEWPRELQEVLNARYSADNLGPWVQRWTRGRQLVDLNNGFDAFSKLGGNIASKVYFFDIFPLTFRTMNDGQILMGTTKAEGSVLLATPIHDLRGVAILDRMSGAGSEALSATVKVLVHGANPEISCWKQRIELPAGQQSVRVAFAADAQGKVPLLWVTLPPESRGKLVAGFRDLEITHATEAAGGDPVLRAGRLEETEVTPEVSGSFFGSVVWRPQQLVVRGGEAGVDGLELSPGGEVWFHTDNMNGEVRGQITAAMDAGPLPFVRVLWYKGGRVQILQQGVPQRDQSFDFKAWTAEPGGWIGIMTDAGDVQGQLKIRLTGSTLAP